MSQPTAPPPRRSRVLVSLLAVGATAATAGLAVEVAVRGPIRDARRAVVAHYESHARYWAEQAVIAGNPDRFDRALRDEFHRLSTDHERRVADLRRAGAFDPAA